jgi:tRNA (guanine37-N1)-methyltransferase
MRIDVVTLFPEMVEPAARFGVTGRALQRGLWRLGYGTRVIS